MDKTFREQKFVSAVVYVHNHQRCLADFIDSLTRTLQGAFENFEVIFVNDYSTDQSARIIKELCEQKQDYSVSLINLSYYQGPEAAIIAGSDMAIGDFVFEFDSPVVDYDYQEIITVYQQALSGYDVVGASPDTQEHVTSRLFYTLLRQYSKNNIQLSTESFRVLSRRAINRIHMLNDVIPYRKAIYYNCGLKTINLKYAVQPDAQSPAHPLAKNHRERVGLAVNSLLLFTDIGAKVATFMAAAMSLMTLFTIIYTIVVYVTYKGVVEGWTTIMLLLSISFTGLFVLLAILIKYVALILYLQHTRQSYMIETIEKIS